MDATEIKDTIKEIAQDLSTTLKSYAPDAWEAMVKAKRAEGAAKIITNAIQGILMFAVAFAVVAITLLLWHHALVVSTPTPIHDPQFCDHNGWCTGGTYLQNAPDATGWYTITFIGAGASVVVFVVAILFLGEGVLSSTALMALKWPEAAVTRDIVERVLDK